VLATRLGWVNIRVFPYTIRLQSRQRESHMTTISIDLDSGKNKFVQRVKRATGGTWDPRSLSVFAAHHSGLVVRW